ncbi:MAG: endonuclease/exonuclease/phosphatase family protein, partial [Cetobacterium sp.]
LLFNVLMALKHYVFIVMWNYVLVTGLLLLSLGVCGSLIINNCATQDLHNCDAAVRVDSSRMAIRYTSRQLLNLNGNYALGTESRALCNTYGILRPKRYLHRSSRCRYLGSYQNNVFYPLALRKTPKSPWRPTGADFKNLAVLRGEVAPGSAAPVRLLKSALINVRSVNNKALTISDLITDHNLDLICLTETWHKESDGLLFNELTPEGYGLCDLPRSTGRGGGIIVLFKQLYGLCSVDIPPFTSFECLALRVSASLSTVIVTVYRPPKINKEFTSDFAELLSVLV